MTGRPRYICTGCEIPYGPIGPSRPVYGYCGDCWVLYLAQLRQNMRRLWVHWAGGRS